MKINFQKEREYYISKLKEYEKCFEGERKKYQKKVRQLEEEVCSFRDHKTTAEQVQENLLERSIVDVDQTIQRIEENKKKIGKSANRLVEMLQMSG